MYSIKMTSYGEKKRNSMIDIKILHANYTRIYQ